MKQQCCKRREQKGVKQNHSLVASSWVYNNRDGLEEGQWKTTAASPYVTLLALRDPGV